MGLGSYPAQSLADARKARDIAKLKKADGVDPIQERKLEKLKGSRSDGDTFQFIALEWHCRQVDQWSDTQAGRTKRQLEDRKSTRLNSSHQIISYAVFCLKKK